MGKLTKFANLALRKNNLNMKLVKITCLPAILFMLLFTTSSCKKDKLVVNQEKQYAQSNFTPSEYNGGWMLTLKPDGVAEVLPTGDIYYRGTYKINGSKISVKTQQNSGSYNFEIISDTEIKEKEFGVLLKLIN